MNLAPVQHRFSLSTLDERAFAALVATAFSIVFSIVLGQVFAAVCFLLFAVALYRGQVRLRVPGVMWLALGFIALAVALSWWHGGGWGLWKRCGKLLWFLLIPVVTSLVTSPGRARGLGVAFLAGSAVLGFKDMLLFPVLAWRNPQPDYLTALIDKGSMTDGQMLMLGFLGSVVILVMSAREGRRVPWWVWFMLIVQLGGLLINFKRGSWFCTIVLSGVVLWAYARWKFLAVAAILMLTVFLLPPVQSRLGTLKKEFDVERGGRLTMWAKIVPALVHQHPEGIGYRCLTNDMMRRHYRKVEPNRNHLHANWAQVLVETGWLGLGLYGVWMVRVFIDGVGWGRRMHDAAWGDRAVAWGTVVLMMGLLLNGVVEYNFGDTELMFVYAILMGLAGVKWVAELPGTSDI